MFWSPDGRKLLLLEPTDREGGVEVVVAEGGEQSSLGAITLPTSLVTETLQFFDQYAQSWQMWSPDSSAVVLPGTIDEETGIWVFSAGGEPGPCGWLKDRFGLSWQVVPRRLFELLADPDAEKAQRVTAAMLQTEGKLDIARLEEAAAHSGAPAP